MPSFLVRLQLHDVPTDVEQSFDLYERLHTAMAAEGYYRCVDDARTGQRVQLPDATYAYHGKDADKVAVGKLAVAVGWRAQGNEKFKRAPGVVVTTCDADTFVEGLDPCLAEQKP